MISKTEKINLDTTLSCSNLKNWREERISIKDDGNKILKLLYTTPNNKIFTKRLIVA
jgi:hypothetical protein